MLRKTLAQSPRLPKHLCKTATRALSTRPAINATKQRITFIRGSTLPALRAFHVSAISNETVKVPQMAESISEGTLKQWLKKKGDYVEVDEEVATIETDKIDVSVNAPTAGTIVELFAEEEDTVAVGNDLFKIEAGEKPSGSSSSESKESSSSKEESKDAESKRDTPGDKPAPEPKEEASSRRQQPKEHEAVKQKEDEPSRPTPEHDSSPRQPSPSSSGDNKAQSKLQPYDSEKKTNKSGAKEESTGEGNRTERRVKMNSMRKRIAERLKQSQNTAASLTTFNEIDMSALMELRGKYKDRVLKDTGVKIGFMSAFCKAVCLALKEFPVAGARIEGDQIVYADYVDLSVAVSTPKGLVTPVIRNAENMSFLDVEQEIARLAKKARDGKLTLEDMSGGNFTISNGGVWGSLFGTPIINLPQSAVLGMHAIKEKAWVVNGKIEIRPIMVVALTYDHRLLDGSDAVRTLVRIKELIEDPSFMLLQ